jgi:hypothetical protein
MVAGNTTEKVEIMARAPQLQTDTAEIARQFDSRVVRELPVQDRNIQEFVGLMTGVTPPLPVEDPLTDPQRNRTWNTNGQPAMANYRTWDVLTNQEAFTNRAVNVPSLETVREFNVRTSNYRAESGRAGGSITGITSSPGTNGFHGSLFEFYAPGTFQARNFFNFSPAPKPHSVSHQFGGTAGFPVVQDRAFVFLGYEGTWLHESQTAISTVPTAEMRVGNFSGIQGVTLFNPLTGAASGTNRTVFANNMIPTSAIRPLSSAILSAVPLPNQPGLINNYVSNVPFRSEGHRPNGRLDWRVGDSTYLFGRYGYSNFWVSEPSPLGPIGNGGENNLHNHNALFSLVHNFSPATSMELRVNYTRYADDPSALPFNLANLPASVAAAFPNGLPSIQITGMSALGTAARFAGTSISNNWNLANTWSHQRGRHSITAGVDGWWIRGDGFLNPQFGSLGSFMFTPGATLTPGSALVNPVGSFANSFASFLVGAPTQIGQNLPIRPLLENWQVAGFASDRIQVTRNLIVDLGVRYDVFSPLGLRNQTGFFRYNSSNNRLIDASTTDKYGNADWDLNNWAPRFGFALRAHDRAAIRGGYTISYWNPPLQMDSPSFIPGTAGFQAGVNNGFAVAGTFGAIPASMPVTGSFAPNQNFVTSAGKLETPSVQQFYLMLQGDLGWATVFDAGYVGNLGRHLPYFREMNAAAPGTGTAGLLFNTAANGFRTASVLERDNGLNSNYNSLQINLTKRFAKMFAFSLAYTWSKSLDYGGGMTPLLNPLNRSLNYGPSDWDRQHMITFSHLWQLPFGPGSPYLNHGVLAQVLGGWQLNGVFRWATGTPFTPTGDPTRCNCPGVTPTADIVQSGTQTFLEPFYFNSFYFGYGFGLIPVEVPVFAVTEPALGAFGNAGRNIFRSSDLTNYNFSIFRSFGLPDKFKLEFRGEAYNLTNTPHFASPVTDVSSLNFGRSTRLLPGYGPRTVQAALRLIF